MWTAPINNGGDEGSSSSPGPATQVPESACAKLCSNEQKALVSCVDSIRAAKEARTADGEGGADDEESSSSSSEDSQACLPMAVSAWTQCCTEANEKENESCQQKEEGDVVTS